MRSKDVAIGNLQQQLKAAQEGRARDVEELQAQKSELEVRGREGGRDGGREGGKERKRGMWYIHVLTHLC